jgi:long-chain acyl-CoA synthetase
MCPDAKRLGEYPFMHRPHISFGPPRIWKKLYAGLLLTVAKAADDDRSRYERALAGGDTLATEDRRALLGTVALEEVEIGVTAAAAMSTEVWVGFRALGLPLSDMYGMSECPVAASDPYDLA